MSISLCVIAKDEEANIGNLLNSAKKLVDEIIVVDTGSSDRTVEIAESYGAKVIISKWRKDFSYHRNESIRAATKEWIIFLDCDEVIVDNGLDTVKLILEKGLDSKYKAFNIKIKNVINGIELVEFEALRIFRNDKDFYFEKPIHEQINNSIVNKYGYDFLGDIHLTILHYGYDENVILAKGKVERNLEILNKIENKTPYDYAMIADEYLKCNNLILAVENYEKSIDNIKDLKKESTPMAIISYLTALINLRRFNKALEVIEHVKTSITNFRDLLFLEYWILNQIGDYRGALQKLEGYSVLNGRNVNVIEVKSFDKIYDLSILKREVKKKIGNLY